VQTSPYPLWKSASASVPGSDRQKALDWLEKAYAQHSNVLATLKVEPAYDSLREEPRFQDVLRRVRLAG